MRCWLCRALRCVPLGLAIVAAVAVFAWAFNTTDIGELLMANVLMWALLPLFIGGLHLVIER